MEREPSSGPYKVPQMLKAIAAHPKPCASKKAAGPITFPNRSDLAWEWREGESQSCLMTSHRRLVNQNPAPARTFRCRCCRPGPLRHGHRTGTAATSIPSAHPLFPHQPLEITRVLVTPPPRDCDPCNNESMNETPSCAKQPGNMGRESKEHCPQRCPRPDRGRHIGRPARPRHRPRRPVPLL